MRYIKFIIGIVVGVAVVYGLFTIDQAEYDPFRWDRYQRSYAALYLFCVFIINLMLFASYEQKKKVDRKRNRNS